MLSNLRRKAAAVAAVGVLCAPVATLADTQIVGAGATFPFPFYSRAFYEYTKEHSDVSVNYQPIGSGGGIQQFTAKTVDFGGSDVPLNSREYKAAEDANGAVIQFPATLGGIAIAYNVPGVPSHIKLTASLLADIYLGKITNWSSDDLKKVNPGVNFPNLPIVVIHRADASGTTYIFTDYLSKVSSEWKTKVGNAKSVNWPAPSSVGGKGNDGVAGSVRNTPGAIGYIELAYALENDIPYASLQNKEGNYVLPSPASVIAAAAAHPDVSWRNFSIVNEPGKGSYPICGYSWVMVWKNQADPAKGKQLVELWKWMLTDGQAYAAKVKYVPLPKNVQEKAIAALSGIHS